MSQKSSSCYSGCVSFRKAGLSLLISLGFSPGVNATSPPGTLMVFSPGLSEATKEDDSQKDTITLVLGPGTLSAHSRSTNTGKLQNCHSFLPSPGGLYGTS